jgi:phosphatidylinositol alpha-1,6-mannosyltransferase
LKILLLTSEFSPAMGGIGTYARGIATAATRLGADVTLMAPDYAGDSSSDDRSLPFQVRRFRGGLHSIRDLPSKIRLARGQISAATYDIVHAADWPFFIPLALSKRNTRARLIVTVHGTEINETQTRLKRLAIDATGVFGPRTEIAANSRYTRDLFQQRFSIDPKQVKAIPLGVSDFWFGPRASREAMRQAHQIPSDRFVMVTVARLTRRKGHHMTLAALARLPHDVRKRIVWLVVGPPGESHYVDEFHRLAQATDCDIRMLGPLPAPQIRDLYGASDLFCLTGVPDPSGRVEGFGLVYLEAAACGLPSVATAIGGVPDAVIADKTGCLVQPSVDDIASAIERMATSPDLRTKMAEHALAHARVLSWERCAAETYGLPQPVQCDGAPQIDNDKAGEEKINFPPNVGRRGSGNRLFNRYLFAALAIAALPIIPARAESCTRSRDYLLEGNAGSLPGPAEVYRNLFKACLDTSSMSNVKDAFVLRDGGIAAIPKQDTLPATAATLSQFCDAHPRATLRFLSRKDLQQGSTIGRIVTISSTGSTSCPQIKGNAPR